RTQSINGQRRGIKCAKRDEALPREGTRYGRKAEKNPQFPLAIRFGPVIIASSTQGPWLRREGESCQGREPALFFRGKESFMSANEPSTRIGIFGPDNAAGDDRHGGGLWAAGYGAVISAAGATPVPLGETARGRSWDELLDSLDGVVLACGETPTPRQALDAEALVRWCEDHELPLLAIDTGMHILN